MSCRTLDSGDAEVLLCVQGRPKGKDPKLSLKPVCEYMRTQGMPVSPLLLVHSLTACI